MTQILSRHLIAGLAALVYLGVLAPVQLPARGRIEGRVLNGTTNQPVANQPVRLLALRQGMQQAAEARTDANGSFAFTPTEVDPDAFYLVQITYQDVVYPAPVPLDANLATVSLTVYESERSEPPLRVESLRVLIRAEGRKVLVQQEYTLQNARQPPRAYVNPEGTFRFRVPPEIIEPTVAVRGMMNMPLPQMAEPGPSAGEFFIRYPIKPGPTVIIVAYEADYAAGQAALRAGSNYPIDRAELHVFPSSLAVESAAFRPAGVDPVNAVQKFEAANLPGGANLDARLSGESAASSEAASGEGEIKVVPSSMTRLGVPLLLCFLLVLVWALGVNVAREWPRWKERQGAAPAQKELEAEVEALFNSLADLDELFAAQKVTTDTYWKERLELKARLVAILKKSPPLLEVYAARRVPR